MDNPKQIYDTLIAFAYSWVMGMIGGMAHYMYQLNKGEHFRLRAFVLNLFLSFFIWYVVWALLPERGDLKYGLVSMSGFCTFPILSWMEKDGFKNILSIVFKKWR